MRCFEINLVPSNQHCNSLLYDQTGPFPVCESDGAGEGVCVFGSHDGVTRKTSTE